MERPRPLAPTLLCVALLLAGHAAFAAAPLPSPRGIEAPPIRPAGDNLTIRKIEVTQAIQCLDDPLGCGPDNSLPLVRGKRTVVRVYPELTGRTFGMNVDGVLETRPCGAPASEWTYQPSIQPFTAVSRTVTPRAQREDPGWSLDFRIEPIFAAGGCLDIRAEINPKREIEETSYADNGYELPGVEFHDTRNLRIKFLRVQYCPGCPFDKSTNLKPPWSAIDEILPYLKQIYPVDTVITQRARREVHVRASTFYKDFGKKRTWRWLLFKVAALKAMSDDDPLTHYYALVPEGVNHPKTKGIAYIPSDAGPVSWAVPLAGAGHAGPHPLNNQGNPYAYDRAATVLAHEIAHNLDRKHAPSGVCDPKDDIDPDWPDATNPDAVIGQTGYDVELGLPRERDRYYDVMSYCRNIWISPYTYRALFEHLTNPVIHAATGPPVDHLIVGGVLDEEGIELGEFFHRELPQGSHAETGEGGHSLDLLDAEGGLLFRRRFDPEGFFFETVPYHPLTARIEISDASGLLAGRDVSASPPVVEILAPLADVRIAEDETLELSWQASDPDGDALGFVLQWSRDGGATWEALETEFPEPRLVLSGRELGLTEDGRFRVIASDGVRSAFAETAEPVRVGEEPAPTLPSLPSLPGRLDPPGGRVPRPAGPL